MHPTFLVVAALALSTVGCSDSATRSARDGSATPSPRVCTSRYFAPRAELEFEPRFSQPGTYAVDLELDGVKQQCSLSVSGVGPATEHGAVVRSPTTRTEMTCKGIGISGLTNEGHLWGLKTEGTPKKVAVSIKAGTTVVSEGTFKLDYKPTELNGTGCGFTKAAHVTLKVANP